MHRWPKDHDWCGPGGLVGRLIPDYDIGREACRPHDRAYARMILKGTHTYKERKRADRALRASIINHGRQKAAESRKSGRWWRALWQRTAYTALGWTYYGAVRAFGGLDIALARRRRRGK